MHNASVTNSSLVIGLVVVVLRAVLGSSVVLVSTGFSSVAEVGLVVVVLGAVLSSTVVLVSTGSSSVVVLVHSFKSITSIVASSPTWCYIKVY